MLLIVSSFSLVQAETFGYGRTETIPINYSLIPTVNNSQYFDGYSVSTLYTYYKSLLDDVYCKLTGCTMNGDIDMGGNDLTNAGDIIADNFIGNGSQLTGLPNYTYIDNELLLKQESVGKVAFKNGNNTFYLTPPIYNTTTDGASISGYSIPITGNHSGKTIFGMSFGVFNFLGAITGKPNFVGFNVFGFGSYGGSADIGDVISLNIENTRTIGGNNYATSFKGIRIRKAIGVNTPFYSSLDIEKTSMGDYNTQIMLRGYGDNTGITFEDENGSSIYYDGISVVVDGNLNVTGNSTFGGYINASVVTSQNGFSGDCVNTTILNGIITGCND